MNHKDRAISYIHQITADMEALSSVTRLDKPALVMILLMAVQKSKSLEVNLRFQTEPENLSCQIFSDPLVDFFELVLNTSIDCISRSAQGERWIKVTLKESARELRWEISFSPQMPPDRILQKLREGQTAPFDQVCPRIERSEAGTMLIFSFS